MSGLIVMVVYAILIEELPSTRIADHIRIPVRAIIHMLRNSVECWKTLVARMAFPVSHLEAELQTCYPDNRASSKLSQEGENGEWGKREARNNARSTFYLA